MLCMRNPPYQAELATVLSEKDVANLEQDYAAYLENKYASLSQ